MQTVFVKGADGNERQLALVRHTEAIAFVCAPDKYEAALADPSDQHVIGLPLSHVRFENGSRQEQRKR